MDIQIAGEQHGLDWCIIRPHNVYGIKQNIWDKYRNVLGIWMFQHLNNQPLLYLELVIKQEHLVILMIH